MYLYVCLFLQLLVYVHFHDEHTCITYVCIRGMVSVRVCLFLILLVFVLCHDEHTCMYVYMYVCMYYSSMMKFNPVHYEPVIHTYIHAYIHTYTIPVLQHTHTHYDTAIPIIIEGQFQVFQRFSCSKLVLKTVESCFVAFNYYGNGSMCLHRVETYIQTYHNLALHIHI